MQEQIPFEIEYHLCRSNGEYRWTLGRGKPVYDSEGNFSGFLGVCHDIHDQKLMEQRKDDFISMASHEMKTPLSTEVQYASVKHTIIRSGEQVCEVNGDRDRLHQVVVDL